MQCRRKLTINKCLQLYMLLIWSLMPYIYNKCFHKQSHLARANFADTFQTLSHCWLVAARPRGIVSHNLLAAASLPKNDGDLHRRGSRGGGLGGLKLSPQHPMLVTQTTFALQFDPSNAFQRQIHVMLSTQKNWVLSCVWTVLINTPSTRESWLCLALH